VRLTIYYYKSSLKDIESIDVIIMCISYFYAKLLGAEQLTQEYLFHNVFFQGTQVQIKI